MDNKDGEVRLFKVQDILDGMNLYFGTKFKTSMQAAKMAIPKEKRVDKTIILKITNYSRPMFRREVGTVSIFAPVVPGFPLTEVFRTLEWVESDMTVVAEWDAAKSKWINR